MAITYSQMIDLGAPAPEFDLPVSNPETVGSESLNLEHASDGKPIAIVFMCNHCPFVVHIEDALVNAARVCNDRGVNLVGISSNDALQYPQDSFEAMGQRAQDKRYPFPYLYDESQSVAKECLINAKLIANPVQNGFSGASGVRFWSEFW